MMSAVTTLHVFVAFVLMISVLLQTGKGSGLGAAFGGTSSSVFGARGPASLISRVTTVAAIIFMATSFTLALYAKGGSGSTLKLPDDPPAQSQSSPIAEAPDNVATSVLDNQADTLQQESQSPPANADVSQGVSEEAVPDSTPTSSDSSQVETGSSEGEGERASDRSVENP